MACLSYYNTKMSPGIQMGDIAIIAQVQTQHIKMGDILAFRQHTSMVVHRVVGITNNGSALTFTTQGDANAAPDNEQVLPTEVNGRVLFTVPNLGWLSLRLKELF